VSAFKREVPPTPEIHSPNLSFLSSGRWLKKSQLSESKRAVNDVKFAPRNFGLKIATASADGFVRIYEASDVFSLGYWPLQVSTLFYLFDGTW
jgi:WD40 repeat protein